jgi:hypothetical protein
VAARGAGFARQPGDQQRRPRRPADLARRRQAEVREYSPLLAEKVALRSEEGVEAIAAKLERRVRGTAGTDRAAAVEPVRFEPELLRGRVLPNSYSPIVQGDEHALIARVALAARVPTAPEPTLRPATQQLFEDALAGSSLESFLHELTSPLPRPHPDHFWHLVEPTKSWVITAERPAARMVVDGWTAEARAAISLKHQPSVGPLGWLILHLDVAIRPLVAVPAPETKEWIPLSLDDLFALLYMPLTAPARRGGAGRGPGHQRRQPGASRTERPAAAVRRPVQSLHPLLHLRPAATHRRCDRRLRRRLVPVLAHRDRNARGAHDLHQ